MTNGTTGIGLEITVVLTEPELLVEVDEVIVAAPTVDELAPERPSKRIVWPGRMV